MGAVADQHADFSIVTNDNPRKEKPVTIIEQITAAMTAGRYEVIVDRREAIITAIQIAGPRDIIVIAGKGHENYQEFADHTIPFDDAAIATAAVGSKGESAF
jgi:UDP-N-acetylmuramoyl-L-alanyl-D-glutamate--2,6-diaminopimelate ligase